LANGIVYHDAGEMVEGFTGVIGVLPGVPGGIGNGAKIAEVVAKIENDKRPNKPSLDL
jgi:hypothetical protein